MGKIKAVKINRDACIGCGSCVAIAPDAFVTDPEDGKVEVKEGWEKVSSEDLRRACDSCPVQAIVLEDE